MACNQVHAARDKLNGMLARRVCDCNAMHSIPFMCVCVRVHCIPLNALHCSSWNTMHCLALHCIHLHCVALHSMHCIPLHSIPFNAFDAIQCISCHQSIPFHSIHVCVRACAFHSVECIPLIHCIPFQCKHMTHLPHLTLCA